MEGGRARMEGSRVGRGAEDALSPAPAGHPLTRTLRQSSRLSAGMTGFTTGEGEEQDEQVLGLDSFPGIEADIDSLAPPPSPEAEEAPAQEEASVSQSAQEEEAVEEMWKWYREWSKIARQAISRKDHLISLGLRKRAPRKASTTSA